MAVPSSMRSSSPHLSSPSALRVSARVLRAAAPRRKSIATSMARTDDIHIMARLGREAKDLLKLLDAGREVNERDTVRAMQLEYTALLTYFSPLRRSWQLHQQRTPLHYVASEAPLQYSGHIQCATLLLDRGADKDAKDRVRPARGVGPEDLCLPP